MNVLPLICLVLALVLELLAAVGVPSPPRFNLMAGGLFFWIVYVLLTTTGVR